MHSTVRPFRETAKEIESLYLDLPDEFKTPCANNMTSTLAVLRLHIQIEDQRHSKMKTKNPEIIKAHEARQARARTYLEHQTTQACVHRLKAIINHQAATN